ncbi:autotransporter outer membrane beta-barrel domain-containing protein [Salmonella enterica]|nr:autotransporter outer membrane beta-barrel domain-containing protein [Salmonella enterica]EBD0392844.1 autotransporter outer membrane beta-barrel domain-containing protein [Salmonella enterica]EBD0405972.1 autotransporter outer membrane beta-barrel domain-containing protein [Salmonella enterica]EBD0438257.1 autotransporter outer membrane beta-barrel domain-containing protein [Salmonella enterica]EBD1286513.1 autotransporter outer membrane beta-barrel domain-containing protein [Salmonella ent
MNRTYSIVWSAVRNMYVVASELARGHSKVKIQAHANEVAPSIEKPESGWTISAKHNALAFAIVAALGFASPLAMADNPVSYIDGTDHDLNAETSPISYSGTGEGTALYLEGLPTQNQGWQPTSATGTGVVIETDGGGAPLSDGSSHAAATAVKLTNGAMLNLTDAVITTSGEYAMGIELSGQSSIMLTGGTLLAGGNYGIMTLSGESQATLSDIKVTATAETGSDVVSQEGSTLNITDGSEITLTRGQLRVVGSTTGNAFLNVSDSTVSSTGTDSTVIASNKGVLDITNSTVTHDNAKGAAIEAGNASTVTISGDNKSSMVINSKDIGIKSAKSSVNIDGATIIAKGDGILMTTGGSSFYSNNSGLMVNNADVTSDDAAALHVDKNTVMEKPITLTDSTLTGPTAIKLDNAATVEANNTTLNGNIDAGSTVSSLSLAEKSSLQGSVNGLNSSLTLDETSQWNMTNPSTVGNLTNDGGITLGNASGSTGTLLTVDNTLTLQDGSQINATLDTANSSPIIKATNVTLDGTLNLSSTATFVAPETDEHLGSFTLIDSQTAITTDFDSVTLDADISAMPDYLTINAGVDANDNTNYELSTGLSWYAGANSARAAHGTFTVDAGSTFTVTSELDETTATSNWDGSKLTKQGDGTLILSNTGNDYGDTEIDGGILAAKDAASLGTGNVTIAESATLALSQGTLDNNVTGGGKIVKTGNDELIVTGDNTYSGGTTITGGTLTADHADSLGTGAIVNSGVLQVGEGELENTLSGSGALVKTGTGELTLSGDNSYSGDTTITGGTLTADHADSLGTGVIANSGVLQVGEGELENTLSGSGALVKTGTGELTLSGDNTYSGGTTITGGTLTADHADSLGTGVIANSGVLQVGEGELENTLSGSGALVKTGTGELTLSGDNTYSGGTTITGGTLTADHADSLGTGVIANSGVLQVGEGELENTLSGSGSLVKTGTGELTLSGDNTYSGDTTITGGTLTADHADSLGTGDIDNSGVLQVGEGELENTLSGTGSLVKTGTGELTLSGDNTYSGGTTIDDGVLIATNVNALGGGDVDNTGTLKLDAEGEFNLANVTTQSGATTELAKGTTLNVDSLTQQADSTLNIDLSKANGESAITADSVTLGGTLNVTGIGSVTDSWTPEVYTYTLIDSDSAITSDFDNLTVAGMNREDVDFLTIDGKVDEADNTHYDLTASLSWYADRDNASTDAHGTFTLSDPDGSFNVAANLTDVDDTLDPNSTWDGKSLTKLGAGKLTLSGANTYSGDTNVQEGTLWLSGDGTIGEMGSQQAVNVASDATFGGSNGTTVNGKVTNEGTLVFGDSEETGAIFTLNGDLINMGTMTSGSSSSTPGNTLYVDGNYTGNGGSLYLNTVLGDDDSATDKLVITGDASGTTDLYINGIGNGAQTTNGIEVVDVGGTSTSDAFVLKNEVNASLYTYRLYWNESDNDWYLASKAQSDDDDSGSDVTPPDDDSDVTPSDDGDDGGDVAPQYRADIGAYMGNQWMARNLQMQTLYDREGSQYRNADGSVWARFKAGKAESEAVSGNIDMDSNYSQFQLGGDILAWGNGQQSVTVGVMASYINADTDSTGNRGADGSQFTSSGNVDGYNLGVYATWFADAQTHSGAYVDSWYQYGFYNNSVESGDAGSESYDSTANAVSLETGYRYDIALSNGNTVSLTPQAQVVWQNYSADSVKDNYGTRIDGQDGDSWTTRLGLRVDGKLYKGSRTVIQPFAEANWLHTSDDVSVSFDDATVKQDLPANRAELKVGLQADIDKQWSVRAQVAGQTGSNDFGDLNGSLNLRYNW